MTVSADPAGLIDANKSTLTTAVTTLRPRNITYQGLQEWSGTLKVTVRSTDYSALSARAHLLLSVWDQSGGQVHGQGRLVGTCVLPFSVLLRSLADEVDESIYIVNGEIDEENGRDRESRCGGELVFEEQLWLLGTSAGSLQVGTVFVHECADVLGTCRRDAYACVCITSCYFVDIVW